MKVCVFLGPSIRVEQAREYLDAVYLPPVQQGDILRVLHDKPAVIGIVDGYFETVPSVWHKEILLAMSCGVHVLGAASMGALRAAELHPFGMEGVGKIYESYVTGELEDDDEVAVAHGPADSGFVRLSEAMVNIRDALQAATAEGILTSDVATKLVSVAKGLYYVDRSYPRILELARSHLSAASLEQLRAFLDSYHPNLKERDAIAMLQRIATLLSEGPPPVRVSYVLERTVFFDALQKDAEQSYSTSGIRSRDDGSAREDETSMRREMLLCILARREASRLGLECGPIEVEQTIERLRRQLDATTNKSMPMDLKPDGLLEPSLRQCASDFCVLEKLDRFFDREIRRGIDDQSGSWKICEQMREESKGDTEQVDPRPTAFQNTFDKNR